MTTTTPGVTVGARDLKEALLKYYRMESMCIVVGANRVPDETDAVPVPVSCDGVLQPSRWYIHSVCSRVDGKPGVTVVTITMKGTDAFHEVLYVSDIEQVLPRVS